MYRFTIALICCAFFLLLTACAPSSNAPLAPSAEAQACEAVKQAIRTEIHAPASATFGHCDVAYSGEDWTVAVAINIPHTDEHGTAKPDTFYYGSAKLDPVTHRMKGGDLVHN
jgi:hypothetical protein